MILSERKLHETENISVRKADVDVEIIPLVEWINKYRGLKTLFSCQGDDRNEPHVLFGILNYEHIGNDINDINRLIFIFNSIPHDFFEHERKLIKMELRCVECQVRFNIKFGDLYTAKEFHKFVSSRYNSPKYLPQGTLIGDSGFEMKKETK